LAELARVARSRDVIVLTAEGGARGPWGGVGAIARHLVQLLGRRARVCVQHDEALRQLFGGVDGEPRVEGSTHEPPGVDGREPLVSLCTAAVTDLVKAAFRRTPGLLLLDDEEHLSSAARRVWRSTGQFVQEINGRGDALRALLVSTSVRTYPAEIGIDRVVIEMPPWRPRDLEHFLSLAFATPGGARDAGAVVHRITGGRPGEVVGYLRELERRGLLQREGLRWSPAAPLSALPPFSGGVADQVSRSLAAAGRDAASLVECLAVAIDVALRRDAVGELCELRGPRLAAAATAAVDAGLLVADGASWRVRTEAVRHKIYAAIPDERRRVLHREVLTHLLDSDPGAVDAVATHARAGGDPRAEAWTREAVQRARDAGEWETALRHLEEAATMVGRSFGGPDVDLQRGELLTSAGRLGEAIEVFEILLERLAPSDVLLSTVRLSAARAFYEAREWERILAIGLPESSARGEQLAELRYIRAAALQHLSRKVEARRESRLAAAELEGEEPVAVQLARLECDYQGRFYAVDFEGVRQTLLTKLRIESRLNLRQRFVADLIKLANAYRALSWRYCEPHAIFVRAVQICRKTAGVSGMTKVALRSNLGLTVVNSVRRRRRLLASAHQVALQSGLGPYVSATRIRLIAANGLAATCNYSDKQYISSYCQNLDRLSRTQMSATAIELASCLVYFAFQQELERLRERCYRENLDRASAMHVRASCILGRVFFDDDVDALIPAMDDGTPRAAALKYTTMEEFLSKDHSYALIAQLAMQGALDQPSCPADWDVQRLIAMTNDTPEPGWGATFLALCLALWIPVSLDAQQWDELNAMVRSRPTPMPVGLEWQRLLLESKRLRRSGDWRGAERVKQQAERQLELLLRPEHGAHGRAAYERWRARLDAQKVVAPTVPASFATAALASEVKPVEFDVLSSSPEWSSAAADVGAAAALVVTSPHRRELEVFAERAIVDGVPASRRWRAAAPIDDAKLSVGCRVVVEFPNLWTKEQVGRATSRLATDRDETTRIVSLLTVPMSEFRERGPEERALAEFIDGKLVKLPPLCAADERRCALFGMVVRTLAPGALIDEDAVGEIVGYVWPGGLGEMETVARTALEIDRTRISRRALLESGWRERLVDVDDDMSETERAILEVVRTTASAVGIAEIAAGSGRPVRTVLRHLEGLMRDGRVVRSGRGRATRYRLPRAGGAHRA